MLSPVIASREDLGVCWNDIFYRLEWTFSNSVLPLVIYFSLVMFVYFILVMFVCRETGLSSWIMDSTGLFMLIGLCLQDSRGHLVAIAPGSRQGSRKCGFLRSTVFLFGSRYVVFVRQMAAQLH